MEVIEHAPPPRPAATAPEGARQEIETWLHRPGTARAILLVSLLVTALAWWAAGHFAQDEARERFARHADDVHHRIERRMAYVETLLRGGVALFAASGEVSRGTWKRYVDTLEPALQGSGIQGLGVARAIRLADLPAHEAALRAEGFGDYAVRPPGARDQYSAIVYLEPFDARNRRAFGFDMLSEPTRREAMLRARDRGTAALSGVVTLVQGSAKDVQPGLLMYLPVYRDTRSAPAGATPDERLWGWVYAPLRVRDLMTGMLGQDARDIAFRIHDGDASDPRSAIHASEPPGQDASTADFALTRPLEVAGRTWQVVYQGRDAGAGTWGANLIALVGVSIDLLLYWSIAALTRRKSQFEAEVALRSDEVRKRTEWLTAVSGLSPDGILVFHRGSDGLHRLVFTNPAFSQWFGLQPAELLGLTEVAVDEWLDGLATDGQALPALAQGDASLVLAGPPRRVLKRGMRESDHQRVYYFRDITHESEVDTLKSEFLSTAAHELRTPLASVYGFAELMLEPRIDAAKRARAARIVYRQAGVLKHLVDELLDLARIDSRRGRDFSVEHCDLRRVAEMAVEAVMRPAELPRVMLDLGRAAVWVHVDPAKMQQAIVNVLSNALKYSQPSAMVHLSLHTAPRGGIAHVGVRVSDKGIGMTPEQCERAFERFYRADPSGHILGAGLGLAIVKEIVELHRGLVELHSEPGQGTMVTLWLPLQVRAAAESPDATAAPTITASHDEIDGTPPSPRIDTRPAELVD